MLIDALLLSLSFLTLHLLRYNINWDEPLGTGLFAVVLRAEEKATKVGRRARALVRWGGAAGWAWRYIGSMGCVRVTEI